MSKRKTNFQGAFSTTPKSITTVSDSTVTVCGCKKIKKYTSSEIILTLCDRTICISGKEMTLSAYCGNEIEIFGEIHSLNFSQNTN